jgi:predicted permease
MRIKNWFYTMPLRLRSLFRRRQVEQELDEELRYHIERQIEENIAKGMAPEEARYAALRAMGGVEQRKEQCRDMRRVRLIEDLMQDLRYGLRTLRGSPGFTVVAALSLALGIGASTAIFSIVKSVLIRPLPFAHADRLTQPRYRTQAHLLQGDWQSWIARSDLVDWRMRSRSFERIGGYRTNAALFLPGDGSPEVIRGVEVTYDLLPALGVQPALGRFFLPGEAKPGRERLIILSDDLWRRRFWADPGIIGQPILSIGAIYVVVGVMPHGFNFPLKQRLDVVRAASIQTGFWTLSDDDLGGESRDDRGYFAIAQLKPGVGAEQGRAELETLFAGRSHANPQTDDSGIIGVRLVSLKDQTIGSARSALLILLGAVSLVVLVVCANIANLLLARADGRRKETAIRQSLGASRFRLVRQALTESLLLALIGGAAGALLANWSLELLVKLSPHNIPRLDESRIDAWTLAFTLAVTVFAGLLFGALPAWRSARVNLNETLKQAAGRNSAWRSPMRSPGNLLVTIEIALALALTLGAGLLLNSFARLMMVDPGVRTNGVLAALIEPNPALFRQVMERLEATPGVVAAGASNGLPFTEHGNAAYLKVEGQPRPAVNDPAMLTTLHIVGGNYLRALDVPLLRGRLFSATDTANALPVTIINETAARRFWNDADPIGKRLSFSRPGEPEVWRQIVGVVKGTHQQGIEKAITPEVYVPVEQAPYPLAMLFVRASLPKAELARSIRQVVAAVDKNVPIHNIISMDELLSDSVSARRFTMLLLGGFSALALTLAVMGVYGVVSYMVSQRTPEIGIRIALGAQSRDVLRLIMAQGLKPVVIGSAIGLMASLALSRTLSSLLYGVTATDPATFTIVILLLSLAALLACYLPARRAMKVDPLVALRTE